MSLTSLESVLLSKLPFGELLVTVFKEHTNAEPAHLGALAAFGEQASEILSLLEKHDPVLHEELKKSVWQIIFELIVKLATGLSPHDIVTYLKPLTFAVLLNILNNQAVKPAAGKITSFAVKPSEGKPSPIPGKVATLQLTNSGTNGYAPLELIIAGEGPASVARRLTSLLEDSFYTFLPDSRRDIDRKYLDLELNYVRSKLAPDSYWNLDAIDKSLEQSPLQFTVDFFLNGIGTTQLKIEGPNEVYFSTDGEKERISFTADSNGNITTLVSPDQSTTTLLRLRTQAFHRVTLFDHLLNVHEVYSSYIAQAHALLPRDSLLFEFVSPHAFGSLIKDSAAYSNLFNQTGLLVEATTVPYDTILSQFVDVRTTGSYDLWPNWYKNVAQNNAVLKDSVYAKRGQLFWDHLFKYVTAGVTEKHLAIKYGPFWHKLKSIHSTNAGFDNSDATFKLLLTEAIFRVSYYHYQVGNAYPYSFNPDIYHWDFSDQYTIASLYSSSIALATSSRQLQLVTLDANAWFPKNGSAAWQSFVTGLVADVKAAEPPSDTNVYVASTTSDTQEPIDSYPSWLWELEPSVAR